MKRQAERLQRKAETKLGFATVVQPVVVIWGDFKQREAWLGEVAVVHGLALTNWLEARPGTLLHAEERDKLAAWVSKLRSP